MAPRTAVILAAGSGTRLGETAAPKALVDVGGRRIVQHALDCLTEVGVERVAIVVGHQRGAIEAALNGYRGAAIEFVVSDAFERTNNAFSLWLAREHLDADAFVLDGDVVFEVALLERLLEAGRAGGDGVTAVAPWLPGMNGTVVELDPEGQVTRMLLRSDQRAGEPLRATFKTINVHAFAGAYLREDFVPHLDRLIAGGGEHEYYERVVAEAIADGGREIRAIDCSDLSWAEVDDEGDLSVARYRFGTVDEQLGILRTRHGSFTRLGVVDHALPRNHHFPSPAMLELLHAELDASISEYPAGQASMQALLAGVVGLPTPQLAVANGASELIKVLGDLLGRVVVVTPVFNEYETTVPAPRLSRFELTGPGFELDVPSLARFAADTGADAVILSSPANPTSIAVPRDDLIELARRLAGTGVRLVLDESFVDFCGERATLEPELARFLNLMIVKSMSKAYGIGGLRLGYLATADLELAARARSALPIWNVNGLAEAFLRHLPAFAGDFRASVKLTRTECDELYDQLAEIPGVYAHPPDANFVLVRLGPGRRSEDVVRALLRDHRLFVKDCAGKSMRDGERYLRVASRTSSENAHFAGALREVLAGVSAYPVAAG